MTKITGYGSLTSPASNDVLPIVDVDDTTMASSGTTKKIAVSDLVSGAGGGIIPPAGDIGGTTGSPTVVSTHLSAALPVAQGGTGQGSQQAAIDALTGTQSAGKYLRSDGTHATLAAISAADLPAVPGISVVTITTTGFTFAPKVALVAGSAATVSWACSGFTTLTGLTPSFNFGTAATRTVYMTCTDTAGQDAMNQIQLFNIGYDHTNDVGKSTLDASFDWTAQQVSGIRGVRNMTALQIFCAANIPALTGTLDCTSMGQLQHIECFGSSLQNVYTGGCVSLIRLNAELNNLTSYNLNTVQPNLNDLRIAFQQGGALSFTPPLVIQAASEWHLCPRDQLVTGMPDLTLMPALQQCWIYNTRQSGTLKPNSTVLASMRAEGNQYTSADFTNQITAATGPDGAPSDLLMDANNLTSITLTGCTGLNTISLCDNAFNQAAVDGILAAVDGFATSNGTLNLAGNPAPSGTGATHVTALQGRGWTVTTGPGSISVVQTAVSNAGSGLSFGSPVTAGNTVLYIIGLYTTASGSLSSSAPLLNGSTVTGTTAMFNPGGSNGIVSPLNSATGVYAACWMLPNCPSANGLTITTAGNGSPARAIALEVHGLGAAPGKGISASGSNATTAAVDAGFMTTDTTTATGIAVGFAQIFQQASAGPAAPWTNTNAGGGGTNPCWAGYRFSCTSGENFAWLQTAATSGNPWAAGIVFIHP